MLHCCLTNLSLCSVIIRPYTLSNTRSDGYDINANVQAINANACLPGLPLFCLGAFTEVAGTVRKEQASENCLV